jgi:hypothetical protein
MSKPFWYKHPDFMSSKDWVKWRLDMKASYPIQYFLRESLSDFKYWFCRTKDNAYYTIRSWFKPAHPIIRKSIPRRWCDLVELIVSINFATILQFKEEADSSWIDWESTEGRKIFKAWLDKSADYIRNGRVILENQLNDAYPDVDLFGPPDPTPFEEKYAEVNRLEALIKETDTKILKEMIDFREHFWT